MSSAFKSHEISPNAAGSGRSGKPAPRPVKSAKPAKAEKDETQPKTSKKTEEIGGPAGPEPTRYGDWEFKGRCIDF